LTVPGKGCPALTGNLQWAPTKKTSRDAFREVGEYCSTSENDAIMEAGEFVRGATMQHTLSTDIAKKLAEHASHLETLNRVAKAIASGIDLGQILQAVTNAATELSGARFGAFFCKVANEEGERYRLAASSGPAPAEFELLANRTSFESAFHGTVVARSDDIRTDLRFDKPTSLFGTPGGLPLASYLAVPVVSNSGEVHGGLFLGHDEAGMFTAEAEQLVAGIAAHAAIALDNARLLRSAQSELLECKRQELAAQRLAAIVESSDDAILAKELNGIVTSWNKGAERIFGYKEEEVIGKPRMRDTMSTVEFSLLQNNSQHSFVWLEPFLRSLIAATNASAFSILF
jgi:PAS domain-containing protein